MVATTPPQLSVIALGHGSPTSAVLSAWKDLQEQYAIKAELIWVTTSDVQKEKTTENVQVLHVSQRSSIDGCWQAGIHTACAPHIMLLRSSLHNYVTPTILRKLMMRSLSPSTFNRWCLALCQRLAYRALLMHEYHRALRWLPVCLFHRHSLTIHPLQSFHSTNTFAQIPNSL